MFVKILKFWDLILLTIFGFFTRFWHLSHPSKVVFDEAHFGLYATKYFSHQYYFDIHPPLGKLLLAFSGFLGGIKPGFDFAIDSFYNNFNFLALRFLPALFGSLLILIIYFLVKEIGFSRRVAFSSGFLVLFDNALIVQSRFILLDIILLFFIFLSFYFFFITRKFQVFSKKWYLFYILTGFSLGAAISIKWTGFGALAIVWFMIIFRDRIFLKISKENLIKSIFIFTLPFLLYFLIFVLHFHLAILSCYEGCGAVFEEYFKTFHQLGDYKTLNVFTTPPSGNIPTKFIELNKLMLFFNLNVTAHSYQSDWYSWPFMIRPILYFTDFHANSSSYVYFFGNPVVWWLAFGGLLSYLYLLVKNYFYKFKLKLPKSFYSPGCQFLFLGYLIYLLPFASIARSMFLYHYLPALIFSIILFSVFFDGVLKILFGSLANKKADIVFFGLLITVFLSFLYFSPLTYGFPLTENGFEARMWLDTWDF